MDKMDNKLINQFINFNSDLPLISEFGVKVNFKETLSGHFLTLMIEIEDHTTQKDIEKSLPFIWDWKIRLKNWQGDLSALMYQEWIMKIDEANTKGHSFKTLANEVNGLMNGEVIRYLKNSVDLYVASKQFKTMKDFIVWWDNHKKYKSKGQYVFPPARFPISKSIYNAFGIPDEKLEEDIHTLVLHYRNFPQDILDEFPFTAQGLREKIRYWRDTKKEEIAIIDTISEENRKELSREIIPEAMLNADKSLQIDDSKLANIWDFDWINQPYTLQKKLLDLSK